MEQVLKIIQENIALISLGVFSLIEFTPIKFSPLDFIGKRLNKTTNENLERTNENLKKTNEHLETYHQEEAKILDALYIEKKYKEIFMK